mmetsp:Transcript_10110/g.33258  ORF Transcript_10110/g.33258 Transcript_10110/m.33258 type:complete len:481 (-) Transcript_10110:9-1451(-)
MSSFASSGSSPASGTPGKRFPSGAASISSGGRRLLAALSGGGSSDPPGSGAGPIGSLRLEPDPATAVGSTAGAHSACSRSSRQSSSRVAARRRPTTSSMPYGPPLRKCASHARHAARSSLYGYIACTSWRRGGGAGRVSAHASSICIPRSSWLTPALRPSGAAPTILEMIGSIQTPLSSQSRPHTASVHSSSSADALSSGLANGSAWMWAPSRRASDWHTEGSPVQEEPAGPAARCALLARSSALGIRSASHASSLFRRSALTSSATCKRSACLAAALSNASAPASAGTAAAYRGRGPSRASALLTAVPSPTGMPHATGTRGSLPPALLDAKLSGPAAAAAFAPPPETNAADEAPRVRDSPRTGAESPGILTTGGRHHSMSSSWANGTTWLMGTIMSAVSCAASGSGGRAPPADPPAAEVGSALSCSPLFGPPPPHAAWPRTSATRGAASERSHITSPGRPLEARGGPHTDLPAAASCKS